MARKLLGAQLSSEIPASTGVPSSTNSPYWRMDSPRANGVDVITRDASGFEFLRTLRSTTYRRSAASGSLFPRRRWSRPGDPSKSQISLVRMRPRSWGQHATGCGGSLLGPAQDCVQVLGRIVGSNLKPEAQYSLACTPFACSKFIRQQSAFAGDETAVSMGMFVRSCAR